MPKIKKVKVEAVEPVEVKADVPAEESLGIKEIKEAFAKQKEENPELYALKGKEEELQNILKQLK